MIDTIRRGIVTAVMYHGATREAAESTASTVCDWILSEEGGREHWVPTGNRLKRDSAIIQELDQGKKPPEISKKYNISVRTVFRVKARRSMGRSDWDLP